MPDAVLTQAGLTQFLQWILREDIPGVINWRLLLWRNDYYPTWETVLADLDECQFDGYARATLDRSTWTAPTVTQGCGASYYGPTPLGWQVGPVVSETVYGYAVLDESTGNLMWTQRFDPADIAPLVPSSIFKLPPVFTLTSAACGSAMLRRNKPPPKKGRSNKRG